MNTKTCLACLAASILTSSMALISPACCGPKEALVGKWLTPNRGGIEYYRPDGTRIILERHGKRFIPLTFRGQPIIDRYVANGDKLAITYTDATPQKRQNVRVVLFKVVKDKLFLNRATLAPGLLEPGEPQIIMLTRVKK